MWIPILLVSTMIAALVWNYTSPNGEEIPWPGWFVSGIMMLATSLCVFLFYRERWKFISQYKYTTIQGVHCYFEPGTKMYLRIDAEIAIDEMLQKWATYYTSANIDGKSAWKYIAGSVVVFAKPKLFSYTALGYWTRKVYGVSGWNWALVGQGQQPIEKTAFAHEIAHIFINHWNKKFISENDAHEIFKEAGI